MAMSDYQKSKFRLSETFNNSNGKTSGSGFIGVISGLIASISFIAVMVGWWLAVPNVLEVFDKVLQLGLLSAALLGVRKFSGALMQKNNQNSNDPETTPETGKEKEDAQGI